MKLGIVAGEFFGQSVGRMGGFGWAARQVATLFNTHPDLGVEVVFLSARPARHGGRRRDKVHNTPIIFGGRGHRYRARILHEKPDLLLTMDYRPWYRTILDILDDVPIVVWVRDPRPVDVQARVSTLRLPGDAGAPPQGIKAVDCRSLSVLSAARLQAGWPVLFAAPPRALVPSLEGAYGISDVECPLLPNIVDLDPRPVTKSASPRVVFLGRLDPIKRPWLFVELARAFPAVEFLMLGQPHFRGGGTWAATDLPRNVRMLGHVDGPQKQRLLSSAWVLVNTSIHESLPTSFLEALACETPVVSFTNQDDVVSRFGVLADGRVGTVDRAFRRWRMPCGV